MPASLSWSTEEPLWPNRTASRFVDAGGYTWHVQIMGSGTPILLLHGTGASCHSFARLMPFLAQHHTVICPDLPGHAFTSTPAGADLSMRGMARAVAALLGALDIRPSLCIGHSAGAAVLARMILDAQMEPVGLIGINAALVPFQGPVSRAFSPLAKLLALQPFVPKFVTWRASSIESVRRLLEGTGSTVPPDSLEIYARLFQTEAHVAGTLAMMAAWDLQSLGLELHRLSSPLLLIVGTNDRTVPPSESYDVAGKVRGARVVRLTGLGHLAHEEAPEQISAIVEEFAITCAPAVNVSER